MQISHEIQQTVKKLLQTMSLKQKIWLMHGEPTFAQGMKELLEQDSYHTKPFVAGQIQSLNIHGIHFIDGPRGVVLHGGATMFPVPMARGASFDEDLEHRIGLAIGLEHRALGGNLFGGVCINLLRHPAWGRAQETYGEDTVLLGHMGAAVTKGVQETVMACVKHFAVNSIENARFKVNVNLSPRALHEVYLPHFKEVVDVGVASVMSSYNAMNGTWCGQNKMLLTDILKDRWGFKGYVITDFLFGMRNAKQAALAGQDIEMPFQMHYARFLEELVVKGEVPEKHINDSTRRILEQQLAYKDIETPPKSVLACPEHIELARETARKSFVLLKNESTDQRASLPLSKSSRIAVIGHLADKANLGDHGSSDGRPDYVITPLKGICSAVEDESRITFHDGQNIIEAADAAKQADTAVVVAGYTFEEEGEYIAPISMEPFADGIAAPSILEHVFRRKPFQGLWRKVVGYLSSKLSERVMNRDDATFGRGGDRLSLKLPEKQEELIKAVSKANANTVVLVMAGSAVTMDSWEDEVSAIMLVWYPGMEGGNAIADVLFGDYSPGGRLPFTIPKAESDLPHFDPEASEIEYGMWHGYKKLAINGKQAAYPFGFGLSYGEFKLSDLSSSSTTLTADECINSFFKLRFKVKNLAKRRVTAVWQLYCASPTTKIERAPRSLVHFGAVDLRPDAEQYVDIDVALKRIAIFDEDKESFIIEKGEYQFFISDNSEAEPLCSVTLIMK